MPRPGGEVTLLLAQLREGNQDAASQLVPLVYKELRRVAGVYMQRQRPDHTLLATALVHEAYMRLIDAELLVAADTLEKAIAIDEALERLAQIDPRQSRLIELRFFAGFRVQGPAEVMGISEIRIKREWRSAKAWLHRELETRKSG
jgi:DNA-directed RNA polymerase specialized sigma24 family protein